MFRVIGEIEGRFDLLVQPVDLEVGPEDGLARRTCRCDEHRRPAFAARSSIPTAAGNRMVLGDRAEGCFAVTRDT